MRTLAKTVNEYINELLEYRKNTFLKLRESILKTIPKDLKKK